MSNPKHIYCMSGDKIDDVVSSSFEGHQWKRFKWAARQMSHSWVELCKVPGLLHSDQWADRTKYWIAFGIPALVIISLCISLYQSC